MWNSCRHVQHAALGSLLRDGLVCARNSLLGSENSLLGARKFPVPVAQGIRRPPLNCRAKSRRTSIAAGQILEIPC